MIPIYSNGKLAGHFNTRTGKMQRTTGFSSQGGWPLWATLYGSLWAWLLSLLSH